MPVSISSDGITFPVGTTLSRPSYPIAGTLRYNGTNSGLEYYTGTTWARSGFPGDSPGNPATSAVQIFDAGVRGKGYFWLSSPNGGTVLNFCDLDTLDENGKAGWILVAQFPNYDWRNSGYSTRATLLPNSTTLNQSAQNDAYTRQWSANWGNYNINRFRIQFADSVSDTGSNAKADWYYHWSTAIMWKQAWNYQAGTGGYINDTSGDNNGNINAPYHAGWPTPTNTGGTVVRNCLRGFNWAYNMKFGYQVGQRWNNLNDPSAATSTNTLHDYWTGLTTPGSTLGWDVAGDGSLGILPQGSSSTTTGHDCSEANARFGYDDGNGILLWSSTATNNLNAQAGTTDVNRPLFFWIK